MTDQKFLSCIQKQKNSMPVWFFRQAGRYLPEYRTLRQQEPDFLKFCYTPELCIEAVLQPIRRYDLDAAIVFSDILVIPDALGQKVWFEGGVGPRLQPLQQGKLTDGLSVDKVQQYLQPVYDAIGGMVDSLNDKPLIGFSGSPWTLACYMVEGQGSRDFFSVRKSALNDNSFKDLIDILEKAIIIHLFAQIEAGVKVVQLFDSWAGILSPSLFNQWVIEPTKRIVEVLKQVYPNIPVMGFARGAGIKNIQFAYNTGVDVITLDETLDRTSLKFDENIIVQGNLDPAYLLGSKDFLRQQIDLWKEETQNQPWIYNLGHGIHKDTDPDQVAFFIEYLRKS